MQKRAQEQKHRLYYIISFRHLLHSQSLSIADNNWRRKWLTLTMVFVPSNILSIFFLHLIVIYCKLCSLKLDCRFALGIPRICGSRGSESWRGHFISILKSLHWFVSRSVHFSLRVCVSLVSYSIVRAWFPDYSKRVLPDQTRGTQRTGLFAFSPLCTLFSFTFLASFPSTPTLCGSVWFMHKPN